MSGQNEQQMFVDLHIHTNFSDGVFTPEEAVRHAAKIGLKAISITDHDTVDGIEAALEEGKKQNIEVIPGIELSSEVNNVEHSEMHILGYFIGWENRPFRDSLALLRNARKDRAAKMIAKFLELGIKIDEGLLASIAGNGAIGRLHFAKTLIKQGFVKTVPEAFTKYLGIGRSVYVPKMRMQPEDAIKMIRRTGGIAVLAHPYYGHYSNRNLLKSLVNNGLRGIEVWHSKHPASSVKLFTGLASEFGLLSTGGSDCHGSFGHDPAIMGNVKIPYIVVEELKKEKEKIDAANSEILR